MISASSWHGLASRFGHHSFQVYPAFDLFIFSHLPPSFPSVPPFPFHFPQQNLWSQRTFYVHKTSTSDLCERFQPLHGAGEHWQEDWPSPKTSAGSIAAGLYWSLGMPREIQKLPMCRTLTRTLWHKTCWQILPFEQAI